MNQFTNLVTGLIGIAGVALFMGIMVWWVKALPLIVITAGVGLLLLYDFILSLRGGNNGGSGGASG